MRQILFDRMIEMPPKKKQEKRQPARQDAKELLAGYEEFLVDLKAHIRSAQIKAATAVNRELIELYWQIGQGILLHQKQQGWGAKVIDQLARDLILEFPDMRGFSPRNLKYMRAFAETWPDKEFVQQLAAQIPWFHNCILMDKLKDPDERQWYIQQTIRYGWSRNVLRHHIETRLYQRQAKAEKSTNFAATLPPPHSDLVEQTIKDEYIFDFLTLREGAHERELERALVERIRDFLLELGAGFAFLGSQYHLEVGGQDFYIDLLFYHYQLRCLIAIDLKMGEFQPADAGQMNFYLSALDDLIRHKSDNPSVGMVLCKGKNRTVAEYALRDLNKPMGVATAKLPAALSKALPSPDELQRLLDEADDA
ncbi:MAG: PDDEXK nuclease domain-containing protein [Acidobacteriota bacterium]